MAYIFKKTRTWWFYKGKQVSGRKAQRLIRQGKLVEKRQGKSTCWYVRLRLPDGRIREVKGFTDKDATKALAVQLQRKAEQEAAGLIFPTDEFLREPVEKHLEEFYRELEARGRSRKHIQMTLSRIRKVFSSASVETLGNIQPQRIREAILSLDVSVETRNHHLVACKAFSRWLWKHGRLASDPLAGLCRWNAEVDRRVKRRVLSAEELGRLLEATEQSPTVFRDLTGKDRAALYLLASFSGLRASELASLTRTSLSLDSDPPTVIVEAAYTKNKRQDVIPLPEDVSRYLANWLNSRPTIPAPMAKLWPGTWYQKAAKMIRQDLVAAGIPPETESGRLDFHSLRGTYATMLARAGVNLQTAQALMRHSDPRLTARTYTKLGITDLGETVRRLRAVLPQHSDGAQSNRVRRNV